MNDLEPKPPELLQNIEWLRRHWRKYLWLLLVAGIFIAVSVIVPRLDWWSLLSQTKKIRKPASIVSKEEKNDGLHANQEPALLVTFNDGSSAYVSLSVQYQLDQNHVIDSFTRFGSAEAAKASLLEAVRGATFSVLEAHSQEWVRNNRRLAAEQIKDLTQDAQQLSAFNIVRLNIMEIEGSN